LKHPPAPLAFLDCLCVVLKFCGCFDQPRGLWVWVDLKLLKDVVDYFVLVESTRTFTSNTKQLYYFENKSLFEKYSDKIIHVIVDDLPFLDNPTKDQIWKNEKFQRNCIQRGFDSLKLNEDDYIIISDVDEIPDPETLNYIKNQNNLLSGQLEQEFYYYNLSLESILNDL
jgi:beta-1,4-mannosyl-glycoprotein beta-1,4-N-acetylglucosaminyltransferase